MALLMEHTAPNGAAGNYFRIARIEGICAPKEIDPRWEVWVNFYASQDLRAKNPDPIFRYIVNIPFSDLAADPRNGTMQSFYSVLKNYAPFAGNAVQDIVEDSPDITLDAVKALKNIEINNARLAANTKSFTYMGKEIACDTLSRSDIDGVNGYVAILGEFPQGWIGKWKAADNTFIDITTIEEWKNFYAAMVAQGQANFLYSQGLKNKVASLTDVDQVKAVYWGMSLTPATSSGEAP